MNAQDPTIPPAWPAGPDPRDGGTMLREAREAAGLSLDIVSQQLKLAPRQVKALEDGEFELLPGRTFVRGFARNYARLLQLDPDTVVNALPGTTGHGGLEAPPLNPTAVTMGELPSAAKGRPVWLLRALVVAALAIVAAGVWYGLQGRMNRGHAEAPKVASPAPVPPPAVASPASGPAAPSASGTPLPNPAISAPLDAGEATTPAAPGAPVPPTTEPAADPAATAAISLTLRGASWVEIKDASGRAVISQTVAPGQSPSVVGSPPFDVVIGNAPDVAMTYRGQAVDLAPFTRGAVARLTLK